jgi:nucleotide-binding universal stress UspA family protein
MSGYQTILVTTDFSDPSRRAVKEAARLAERLGSRLVLAYVVEDRLPPMILAISSRAPEAILEEHRRHAKASLADLAREQLPGREVETRVLQGVPHQAIVEFAREEKVDLIVMGMHGHGFVGHALAGSTTERVLHHAPCPVLVVRH